MQNELSHLDWLEAEAIHIMREVAGQCSNPVLLFSGGKDSLCLLRIAEKAFRPGMQVVVVACDEDGNIDLADLREKIDAHQENLAAMMVTYPSTHGPRSSVARGLIA